jgi:hypothetical protein
LLGHEQPFVVLPEGNVAKLHSKNNCSATKPCLIQNCQLSALTAIRHACACGLLQRIINTPDSNSKLGVFCGKLFFFHKKQALERLIKQRTSTVSSEDQSGVKNALMGCSSVVPIFAQHYPKLYPQAQRISASNDMPLGKYLCNRNLLQPGQVQSKKHTLR